MNCEAVLELLLEADLEELEGRGDSPVAAHVRSCARCADVARRLLAGERLLAAALDEIRPSASADEAIAGLHVDETVRTPLRLGRRPRWRPGLAAALPLAAAAGLALLLLRDDATPPEPLPIARVAEHAAGPVVTVPVGSNAAIFKTSNPKITVVWFYR